MIITAASVAPKAISLSRRLSSLLGLTIDDNLKV
jgi:hypothetical protein